MQTKTNYPYQTGQPVLVEVWNAQKNVSEWIKGIVNGEVMREDKPYGVNITLEDGRCIGSPYGAAPECVKGATY